MRYEREQEQARQSALVRQARRNRLPIQPTARVVTHACHLRLRLLSRPWPLSQQGDESRPRLPPHTSAIALSLQEFTRNEPAYIAKSNAELFEFRQALADGASTDEARLNRLPEERSALKQSSPGVFLLSGNAVPMQFDRAFHLRVAPGTGGAALRVQAREMAKKAGEVAFANAMAAASSSSVSGVKVEQVRDRLDCAASILCVLWRAAACVSCLLTDGAALRVWCLLLALQDAYEQRMQQRREAAAERARLEEAAKAGGAAALAPGAAK